MQAEYTLEDIVRQLNEAPDSVLDLQGQKVFGKATSSRNLLALRTDGAVLKNGVLAIPANTSLLLESDCSLELEELVLETIIDHSSPPEQASTDLAPAATSATVTLATNSSMTVKSVRCDGAAQSAFALGSGATLIGAALSIRGTCDNAIAVEGGSADVKGLHVTECTGAAVYSTQHGIVHLCSAWLGRNAGGALNLEGRSKAVLATSHMEGPADIPVASICDASELQCNDCTVTSAACGAGIAAAGSETSVHLGSCSFSGLQPAMEAAQGAYVNADSCKFDSCGSAASDATGELRPGDETDLCCNTRAA